MMCSQLHGADDRQGVYCPRSTCRNSCVGLAGRSQLNILAMMLQRHLLGRPFTQHRCEGEWAPAFGEGVAMTVL